MLSILTSDQGHQFTSSLWAGLTKLLGVKHVQTTAFIPQSNGMVERTHGQLKAALRARLASSRWPEHLPWFVAWPVNHPEGGLRHLGGRAGVWAALALPAEFLSAAEPPATEFLKKLQMVEMPATRPLSYVEAVATPLAAFLGTATSMCSAAARYRLYRHSTWGLARCCREQTISCGVPAAAASSSCDWRGPCCGAD
jgi:hypothetical protein